MVLEKMLLIPWIDTVVLESAVALIWGYTKLKDLGILALINTITNIPLNLALTVLMTYLPFHVLGILLLVMEAGVFLTEGLLIRSFIKNCRHPFVLSLTMNLISFCFGFVKT